MKNSKGIVNLSIFPLIVIIFLFLFLFVFYFVQTQEKIVSDIVSNQELFYSTSSFRSEIIQLISQENSSLIYQNIYENENIEFILYEDNINATKIDSYNIVSYQLKSLGIRFCSSYEISPLLQTNFTFNGSCIMLVS